VPAVATGRVAIFPKEQFKPPKCFKFPKRKFGAKACRSFRFEWSEQYDWLHYDVGLDAAFCYLCMKCEQEKKFLASTKRDPAFISKGFTYWKDANAAFKKHLSSVCHKEAVDSLINLPKCTKDVAELQNAEHAREKASNRRMFMLLLRNIRYLARQGLPLRGHGVEELNSNFVQLLHLQAQECKDVNVQAWLDKRTNKYTSPEIQNECSQIMALHILREVSQNISSSSCYSILADECTDTSNKEQFTINIRWVDKNLEQHEDFIGLYQVDSITSESLFSAIKDVLLRMNLKLTYCRGQCYDGASNMSGSRSGVATRILNEEKRALYTHCYGHALNLAVSDTVKKSKVCKDALETAFEITRLVKFSPKRNTAFDRIRAAQEDDLQCPVGLRTFCHTRWTVRGDALESVVANYTSLFELWEESLDSPVRLDPDVKARIIGVKTMMQTFNFLYGLKLTETVLKITDNLSRTLQHTSLSAAEGQRVASMTVATLESMRTDQAAQDFFGLVQTLREKLGVDEAALPRQRKLPKRYDDGAPGFHNVSVEQLYRTAYFEAIDLSITSIRDRFDQPGYTAYRKLEDLLLKACEGADYTGEFQFLCELYEELDISQLDLQLKSLQIQLQNQPQSSTSIQPCITFLRDLSPPARTYFSEVVKVVELLLVMPGTNATSERSFSTMRRIKSYLRTTMRQDRLNHLMVLHMYKDKLDSVDLRVIGNEFVALNERRKTFFGTFE
jgi:hypothetical protein